MKHTEKEVRSLIHQWLVDENEQKVKSPEDHEGYRNIAKMCSYSIIQQPERPLGHDVLTVLWHDLTEQVDQAGFHHHEYFSLFYLYEDGLKEIAPSQDREFSAAQRK